MAYSIRIIINFLYLFISVIEFEIYHLQFFKSISLMIQKKQFNLTNSCLKYQNLIILIYNFDLLQISSEQFLLI